MNNDVLLILLYITVFGLGYAFGRLKTGGAVNPTVPTSFLKNASIRPTSAIVPVHIDETKYVAPIQTAGLVLGESTNSIGKTTTTTDDIQSSVSKLAQLKGK